MKVRNRTRKKKITLSIIRQAIEKHCGNISAIARAFKIERPRIYEFVERHPELKEEIEKAREIMVEEAENYLLKNIRSGKETSIIFTLKTLGKKKGYVEKQEVEHTGKIALENIDYKKYNKEQLKRLSEAKSEEDILRLLNEFSISKS